MRNLILCLLFSSVIIFASCASRKVVYMQVDTGYSRVIFIVSEGKAGTEGVEKTLLKSKEMNKKKDDQGAK